MHYKNGREAKNGDKVVFLTEFGPPVIGILYDAEPGNNACNGNLALCRPGDPVADLSECLHYDDVRAVASADTPDSSSPEKPIPPGAE